MQLPSALPVCQGYLPGKCAGAQRNQSGSLCRLFLCRAGGSPKINLQVRASNEAVIKFYQSLGYSDDKVIGFGKRLEEDES